MSKEHDKKVAIVGGGMAGMSAALFAAMEGAGVYLFERNKELGKKLLMTGNGRCNITNEALKGSFDIKDYYAGDTALAGRVLDGFTIEDTLLLLGELGIYIKSREGWLYPYSDQASSVRDAFERRLEELGVFIKKGSKVTGIEKQEKELLLTLGDEESGEMSRESFDACVLACGGRAYPHTGSDGFGYKLCKKLDIPVKKSVPSLTKCLFKDEALSVMAGVRMRGELTLLVDGKRQGCERGEIQFLKNAISGIVCFQLSGKASRALDEGRSVTLLADLFEEKSEIALYDYLYTRFEHMSSRALSDAFTGFLNDRAAVGIILKAGLKPDMRAGTLSDAQVRALVGCIKALEIRVMGVGGFNDCQVCSGGIRGDALDEHLMVRAVPGLFAAGELIDVDGLCGGFNLQFAISSGQVAGKSCCNFEG